MSDISADVLRDMIEGRISPDDILTIQRREKEPNRFELIVSAEQQRVPWPDKILLPLQEHLYVVENERGRVTKCFCGQEFGDYRENWKFESLVYERNPADGEIYVGPRAADPEWTILREFYCPGCAAQLDVEAVPHGHPFVHNQEPDIEAFMEGRRG